MREGHLLNALWIQKLMYGGISGVACSTRRVARRRALSYASGIVTGMWNGESSGDNHDPTVKDSPHPQASLIFGFLNANFALLMNIQ